MLVRFSAENFLSFREEASLSMVPSSERIHPHHVIHGPSTSLPRVVRAAAVYGPNAAGKSNLVKALRLLKSLVVGGVESGANIPVERFRLDPETTEAPSVFRIDCYVGDRLYNYELAATTEAIASERLTWIRPTKEQLVFSREVRDDKSTFEFGKTLRGKSQKDKQFLDFVARGTRSNQPFLAEAVSRNVEELVPIVDWFRATLQVISPDDPYGLLEFQIGRNRSFRDFFRDVVAAADTGIADIETHDESLDSAPDLPEDVRKFARDHLPKGAVAYAGDEGGRRVAIRREGDEFIATRITTLHNMSCGATGLASFELDEESDGTRRLFDLIPVLYQSAVLKQPSVFVIDEIGRSLHPHLVRMILQTHGDAEGSGSQLIATTHEASLLDLDLLRRDEIWFVEMDDNRASKLYSLHEFQPRYDKDIRGDYLVGRYGAVPFLGNFRRLVDGDS